MSVRNWVSPGSTCNYKDHVSVCHALPSQGLGGVKTNSPSETHSKENVLNVKDAKKEHFKLLKVF